MSMDAIIIVLLFFFLSIIVRVCDNEQKSDEIIIVDTTAVHIVAPSDTSYKYPTNIRENSILLGIVGIDRDSKLVAELASIIMKWYEKYRIEIIVITRETD